MLTSMVVFHVMETVIVLYYLLEKPECYGDVIKQVLGYAGIMTVVQLIVY